MIEFNCPVMRSTSGELQRRPIFEVRDQSSWVKMDGNLLRIEGERLAIKFNPESAHFFKGTGRENRDQNCG